LETFDRNRARRIVKLSPSFSVQGSRQTPWEKMNHGRKAGNTHHVQKFETSFNSKTYADTKA
jgi:hypothetical protein